MSTAKSPDVGTWERQADERLEVPVKGKVEFAGDPYTHAYPSGKYIGPIPESTEQGKANADCYTHCHKAYEACASDLLERACRELKMALARLSGQPGEGSIDLARTEIRRAETAIWSRQEQDREALKNTPYERRDG